MSAKASGSVAERFNAMPWHDSKLLGLALLRTGGGDEINLSLQLRADDGRVTPAEIVFKDCGYAETNIYLEAKRLCADDIAEAECNLSSDWKDFVSQPGPYDPVRGGRHLEEHLHFRIDLCPPGGSIDILAKNFALSSEGST